MFKKRTAFTLVELLVVIAIIAMLVSLLLPAVQQAREAARRSVCSNKVRQLTLAVINYESALGELPPAGIAGVNRTPNIALGDFVPNFGRQISWIVLTLPYMEEEALYNQFDFDSQTASTVFELENNPASAQPASLLCASDSALGRFCQGSITDDVPIAKGNYAAWVSPFHVDLQGPFPGALGNWGNKLKKVTDGLSSTFMISEVRTRSEPTDQRGAWAVPWNGSSLLAYDGHYDFDLGGEFEVDRVVSVMQTPNHAGPNLDPIYDCQDPAAAQIEGVPCAEYTFAKASTQNAYLSSAPRSNHPGGVNVGSMDGSIRFVTDDVDPLSMAYRVSINDGKSGVVEQ